VAWNAHIKGKRHLTDEPDKHRKVCEKCNIEFRTLDWTKHLNSKNHLENDLDHIVQPVKSRKVNMLTKLCEKCDVEIPLANCNAWSIHLKSKTHLENKPDKSRKV
jgi:hypothetical protein